MAFNTNNTNSNDVVNHGLNAAQASADDNKSKEQVDQLSAKLKGASASSQADSSTTQK